MKPIMLFLIVLISFNFAQADIFNSEKVLPTSQAIVCRDLNHNILEAQLYDYYEAKVLRDININLGSSNVVFLEKALMAIERLKKYDHKRYVIYRSRINDFLSQTLFKENISIDSEEYSGDMIYPKGCKIENVLKIFKGDDLPGNKKYLINSDIWNAFDNNSKAGLIIHEAMLQRNIFTLNYKITKRMHARTFNSLIASDLIKKITQEEYTDFIGRI
ncbi:MAG: hypothetical protein A2381_15825 [Bdellovibrionales bacterium RIFOXYB1_FULL_37_110]|nr:MAG: hypothetical protein A2417_07675 [Bdellovibrionales bacterium RIFOXYC1_FULL_37_79]OFZ57083.1 MAG: hypothetical protein A2381_15825 [Bdellovibrionales bacterium RIFOXYB1_FULL_37_110]OFZ62066.1 MAG: hypothetical protein A2577_08405 [Bdellovibrionales bacterium RIFOXYD1_FULL_36_51]